MADAEAGKRSDSDNGKVYASTSLRDDLPPEPVHVQQLARKLSARQVQMIAIGGYAKLSQPPLPLIVDY